MDEEWGESVGAGCYQCGQEKWRHEGKKRRSKELEAKKTDHLSRALRNWHSVYFGCW